jgi:hypothetical protein
MQGIACPKKLTTKLPKISKMEISIAKSKVSRFSRLK